MRRQPIMKFNKELLQKLLSYWKRKLFLDDWIIHARLVPPEEINGYAGKNIFTFVDKSSSILIADIPLKDREEFVSKVCDECTLVHELLHCKYNFLEDEGTYEDVLEHQKLEQMAKTLIMVKYNLPYSWFDNAVD